MNAPRPETCLLLGADHGELGTAVLQTAASGQVALALSAGVDESVRTRKEGAEHLNEDVALAWLGRDRWILAVADGHEGIEASHRLVQQLAMHAPTYPRHPNEQARWWRDVAKELGDVGYAGTTLVVAVWEPLTAHVRGLSYGDSRIWRWRPRGGLRDLAEPTHNFVRPGDLYAWHLDHASTFDERLQAGDVLLLHSDGVTECCYRTPEASVTQDDLEALCELAQGDPDALARAVLDASLQGVRGQPGGQDNVAVVVARPLGAVR